MEKQSLIKYYCALFLVLVLLAGSNNAVAAEKNSPKPSSSAAIVQPTQSPTPPNKGEQNAKAGGNILPLILSILALAASGSAIALTILKNKKINDRIQSDNEKYNTKLKSLENKYTELLTSQKTSPPNQQGETYGRNSENSSDTNPYLDASIERLSERISELENKLQATPSNQQSIIPSNHTYLSSQSRNLESEIDPFNQTANLTKSDITQPLENLAYIELVNTYNTNPKLLEQTAIKVSEPTDSINRRHADSSQKIVLEKANNSNYWVMHNELDRNCWLLPKSKLRIDQFRYETTKALFECHGYHPEYSTFKLVKPAKVIPLSSDEQTWQLEEPGILKFSVEA